MSVSIKSAREIELMRAAGKILAKVHDNLKKELREGMSTLDIDRLGEEIIRSYVFLLLKITMVIRLQSVYRSMMRWFMAFQLRSVILRKVIL